MKVGRISVVIQRSRKQRVRIGLPQGVAFLLGLLGLSAGMFAVSESADIYSHYTLTWRSPVRIYFESPVLIAQRTQTVEARNAQRDARPSLTAYQQYACQKFGPACRMALAIQPSETQKGNARRITITVTARSTGGTSRSTPCTSKRRGVNLRDLLDCKANIETILKLVGSHCQCSHTTLSMQRLSSLSRTVLSLRECSAFQSSPN
jgi:hypothetical protein